MILRGTLPRGAKVPSTRAMAETLGISRTTVTASYDYLLSEGYLEAAGGSGTYVSRHLPEELLRAQPTEDLLDEEDSEVLPGTPRLSRFGASLDQSEWMGFAEEEPEIQFSFGRPDFEHFPMREWMQLVSQHSRRRALSALDCPSKAVGYQPLREALSGYLKRSRGLHCTADQIIIVNGSQQGIDLVCRVLVDHGDTAAMEEPGYLGAQKALRAQGAKIVPVEVDHSGLKVDELKRRCREEGHKPKLVYVTPSHQFPRGVVMSLPRRLDLLTWANRTGTFIVEDDYDSEYRYKGRPIPALAGLTHHDSVIYIGTFSKVLLPSMRLGYLVVPEKLARIFARAKWIADRHSPLIEQQALADFIKLGYLERHVRRTRALYEHKRKLVLKTISDLFGDAAKVFGDNAGINVLVRFDTSRTDQELSDLARARGVGITSTRQYYMGAGRRGEFLLNYGGLSEEKIVRGLLILSELVLEAPSAHLVNAARQTSAEPTTIVV